MEKLFSPGQRIFVGAASNEPKGLLEHIQSLALPENLRFIQFPIAGLNGCDFTAFNPTASVETFFMTPTLAKADLNRVHYLPMQMRWIYDYIQTGVDVALIQIAPDRNGDLCIGPNSDFVEAALQGAKTVIAQLNTAVVAPAGCSRINSAIIDDIYECAYPLPELPLPKIDDTAAEIGRLVAELIDDGDCIQAGIGAIPAAILKLLNDKNDLGLHGGLIDDAGIALIENGNVTGTRKEVDHGRHITGMALCNEVMFNKLAKMPEVIFRGANYTHEVSVMSKLRNFVSINSAVEIDLYGQVNAEFASGRQISGTGGSVDFMRGAKASKGGRSIVAMNATARRGEVSRIVPKVDMVTALRTDVDIVVTEYGVARLKHLTNAERKAALIEIAAPAFRDQLRAAV